MIYGIWNAETDEMLITGLSREEAYSYIECYAVGLERIVIQANGWWCRISDGIAVDEVAA